MGGGVVAVLIPHLDWPIRMTSGGLAVVEQDSEREIENCVRVILQYPRGYRIEEPDFGIDPQEFRMGGADLDHIKSQIIEWEPRAQPEAEGELEDMISRVRIEIKVEANG